MGSDAEADLIGRCRRGEPTAWDELFNLHYAPVARFVFQLDHHFTKEDSEEICQETFLAAIKHLGSFQGQSQLQTWLFRIAANKARDFRERLHAAKRGGGQVPISLQQEDPDTGLVLDPASSAPGPDAALLKSEQGLLVTESLDRLGDPCREIIELRYFGDLSYEEISAELQLNPKTVSSRLSKCLDKLEEIARNLLNGENSPVSPSNL